MTILGPRIQQQQYVAFSAAVKSAFPLKKIQTGNDNGGCFVNGNLTAEEIESIRALYHKERLTQAVTTYDIFQTQSLERRRRQTFHARYKRQANAIRFHR